eukprot:1053109-Rhodomonas_salina.1
MALLVRMRSGSPEEFESSRSRADLAASSCPWCAIKPICSSPSAAALISDLTSRGVIFPAVSPLNLVGYTFLRLATTAATQRLFIPPAATTWYPAVDNQWRSLMRQGKDEDQREAEGLVRRDREREGRTMEGQIQQSKFWPP